MSVWFTLDYVIRYGTGISATAEVDFFYNWNLLEFRDKVVFISDFNFYTGIHVFYQFRTVFLNRCAPGFLSFPLFSEVEFATNWKKLRAPVF